MLVGSGIQAYVVYNNFWMASDNFDIYHCLKQLIGSFQELVSYYYVV